MFLVPMSNFETKLKSSRGGRSIKPTKKHRNKLVGTVKK